MSENERPIEEITNPGNTARLTERQVLDLQQEFKGPKEPDPDEGGFGHEPTVVDEKTLKIIAEEDARALEEVRRTLGIGGDLNEKTLRHSPWSEGGSLEKSPEEDPT